MSLELANKDYSALAKQLLERINCYGDKSEGTVRFVADIVELCAIETEGWTNRYDDATRIPEMLYETSFSLHYLAKKRFGSKT